MGAQTFFNRVRRETAKQAFSDAREDALYSHGHDGYTGTIAEKHLFIMSRKPEDFDTEKWIDLLEDFDEEDTYQDYYNELKHDSEVYDYKWGEALCIKEKESFVFCGWASS